MNLFLNTCPFQEQETARKEEAELEKVRRDRGEGVPVPLAPRGRQESARNRREVEVSLDHGDTEDSDDQLSGNDEETGNDMNMSALYIMTLCADHLYIHTYSLATAQMLLPIL